MKAFYSTLVLTFFMGLLSGSYVYFITTDDTPQIFSGGNQTGAFEIIGDSYGGCQMLGACPSYIIREDGSYSYLIPKRGEEPLLREGELSRAEVRALKDLLRSINLAKVEASTFTGTCSIAFDGVAYRYEIHIGEMRYRVNTCQNDVQGELFNTLKDYFEKL